MKDKITEEDAKEIVRSLFTPERIKEEDCREYLGVVKDSMGKKALWVTKDQRDQFYKEYVKGLVIPFLFNGNEFLNRHKEELDRMDRGLFDEILNRAGRNDVSEVFYRYYDEKGQEEAYIRSMRAMVRIAVVLWIRMMIGKETIQLVRNL